MCELAVVVIKTNKFYCFIYNKLSNKMLTFCHCSATECPICFGDGVEKTMSFTKDSK